jgi:hypothetical protein
MRPAAALPRSMGMTRKHSYGMVSRSSANLGWGMARMMLDAQVVITRRLAMFSSGHPDSAREATRMVMEKMHAGAEAQRMLLSGKSPPLVMAMLGRKVAANRRRLK